jgi:hypothetical protein
MNILKQCGLENRLITKFDSKKIDELKEESIDWKIVNNNIHNLKNEAIQYLKNSIGDKNE